MDWDKLKTFYCVAKQGSMTSAGEHLNISQSAVSRQILILEERLGKKILNRRGRGISLTKYGEILFKATENMIVEAEIAKTAIQEDETEPQGELKVAVISGFCSHYFMPLIPEFTNRYPKIHLSIVGTDKLPGLSFREVDVLIHPAVPAEKSLIQHPLMTSRFKIYASRAYLEKFGTPERVEDLDHHRLIAYGDHSNHPFPHANWILSCGKRKGQLRQSFMDVNTSTDRFLLAEAGLGIVTLPQEHPGLKESNLVEILPEIEGPVVETHFIFPEQLEKSKRVLVLLEYLKESISFKNS